MIETYIIEELKSRTINNKYCYIYIALMNNKINRDLVKDEYVEKHHILPKSIWPDLSKDNSNIIPLTPKEHYIAHLLLSKMFEEKSQERIKMCWALHRLTNSDVKNSRNYDLARKLHAKMISETTKGRFCITDGKTNAYIYEESDIPMGWWKGITRSKEHEEKLRIHRQNRKPLTEETKKKISESNKGRKQKPRSKETRDKMSKLLKGRKFSEDWRKKLSKASRNRMMVTNGKENKRIPICEDIPLGWWKGCTRKVNKEIAKEGYRKRPIKECPHCGFKSKSPSIGRWHFDNCKHRKS